jgi:hypothetical protein
VVAGYAGHFLLVTAESTAGRKLHLPLTTVLTGSGLSPELKSALEKFIKENKIVLFIKGTKQFPQCGFSNTVVQVHVTACVHTTFLHSEATLLLHLKVLAKECFVLVLLLSWLSLSWLLTQHYQSCTNLDHPHMR